MSYCRSSGSAMSRVFPGSQDPVEGSDIHSHGYVFLFTDGEEFGGKQEEGTGPVEWGIMENPLKSGGWEGNPGSGKSAVFSEDSLGFFRKTPLNGTHARDADLVLIV